MIPRLTPTEKAKLIAETREGGGLLRCPFCGGAGMTEHFDSGRWQVSCADVDGDCLASISWGTFATEREAITAWNTRSSVEPELLSVMLDMFENPKFQVAIGGNPNMVDALMERARAAIAKAQGQSHSPSMDGGGS